MSSATHSSRLIRCVINGLKTTLLADYMGAKSAIMNPTSKKVIAAATVMLSHSAPAFAGPLEDADTAHREGDYATALRLLSPLADQGHPIAQFLLGIMHFKREGVCSFAAELIKQNLGLLQHRRIETLSKPASHIAKTRTHWRYCSSISSSLARRSAASRICARLSLRAHACRRSAVRSVGRVRIGRVRPDSVHSSEPPLVEARTSNCSDGQIESPGKNLHAEAGPVSGVYPPLYALTPPTPGRNRHAAILPR
jgi:hypothetical protein